MVDIVVTGMQSSSRQPDWKAREQTRLSGYDTAREFADGIQWTTSARRGETRLTFNYARALVRKVASYCFPAPTAFAILDTPDENTEVEQLLGDYLQQVSAHELDLSLSIESSILGDAAVKVTWDPVTNVPVIGQVDPATLAAWWDPTLPSRLYRMEHRYQLPGQAIATAIGRNTDGLDAAKLYPILERWTDQQWSLEVQGQLVIDEPNPYGWIPYVVVANERPARSFWGQSDLLDIYDVCRELNSRMSSLSSILELSGAPIAVLEGVDSSEGIAVRPGAKWELPDDSKAYLLNLLEGGGVNLHIDYIQSLYRALHDLSETPRTAFGDSGRTLSGTALEVEIQPLVQRVRRKRSAFDRFYQARNFRILDLMERFGTESAILGARQTKAIWPPVLPSDEDALVRNQTQLVRDGISSRSRAAQALGNDNPEAELDLIIAETQKIGAAGKPAKNIEEDGIA